MLNVSNVSKQFGGLKATDDVSLGIEAGTISALIGPNGAGKTTLFSLISGFIGPSSGEILFEGTSIVGLPPEEICRRGIARTFQIVQPFAGLTVRENITIGAHLHLKRRRDALAYAGKVGELVGLTGQLDKQATALTISGRKRLEVARALATRPKLLLLDEVMAGLNPVEIDEILPIIRNIRNSGVTVFLIEHVMRAVMSLSEKVWVLNNGGLIAEGAVEEVIANPLVIEAYLGHGAVAAISPKECGV